MESRAWLARLEAFGVKLGLDTMRRLTAALDHPELSCRIVHVAGTNGKGSVTAMVGHGLTAGGHRTARYTSPHLMTLDERFVVDGQPLPAESVDAALDRVRRAVSSLQASGALAVEPTYFEVATAAAFVAFRDAGADLAVVEVGLGGRLDATNVVSPMVTAITSIARDHEAQLGRRLDTIAAEKAGIVKPGVAVVVGPMPAEAAHVIEAIAQQRGAALARPATVSAVEMVDGVARATFETAAGVYGPVSLALRGRHQVDNAAVAVRVLELVHERGIDVDRASIEAGLSEVTWRGRLELVGRPPKQVLVDGAHNPAGMAALAAYLRETRPDGLPVVFGAMRDKPLADMLAALAPVARPLVLTLAPGERAASPGSLFELSRPLVDRDQAVVVPDLAAALRRGWAHAPIIAAAGSLYLAGEILTLMERA
jgi:dihydrofolate synthase/folylpolyglutamate synthase